MLKVVYRPEAEAEILEAVHFYKSRVDNLGDRFLAAINDHVHDIASAPERFTRIGREVRQCVVRKYPFIIFFSAYQDHVRILAVAHTSRNPHYWKRRK
jgi:toxin ParE1/3/4